MRVLFLLLLSSVSLYAQLPEPYNSVQKVLPFNPANHFGERQSFALNFLIKKYKCKNVVEIGSYLGASTRFIARIIPEDGKVYAVDHWLGNAEWENQPNFKEKQAQFYNQFLSNIIHAKLCHKVIPMRMKSVEGAKVFKDKPDLVFIDGAHDYNSVYADICAWYPFVKDNGIMSGDDFHWGEGYPVKRAVERFAKEHGLRVNVIKNWIWYYEKN